MRRTSMLLVLLMPMACQQELTPAQVRAECQAQATNESGFDPLTAEAPPRTVSSTHRRGGKTLGSGAVAKGGAGGAAMGALGGAIAGDAGEGAAAGAAIGALIGGVRRHKETNEMVTTSHANPEYQEYVQAKKEFKRAFDACMAQSAGTGS